MKSLAVVTGASSGIGAALAWQLAGRGHPVLAVARRAERLAELAARAAAAGHAPVHAMALDVTAPHAAAELAARARELGGAGWLVNNAGGGRLVPLVDDAAAQAPMVRLNCESLVAITAAFVGELVAQKAGVILNVASSAGFQPTPGMTTYGATKAFVLSFSEGLAEELRGTGVTVTALCPGPVASEFFAAAGNAAERTPSSAEMTPAEVARYAIDAAERGRVVAVPGVSTKLLAWSARFAPRSWVRRLSGRMTLPRLGYKK
ncbi:MAG TPA: SDR family NAD(P)-dependent oxidoreductase [Polyangia bacterium]|nr:SDR family NAD(P)-dependent oxidoreductase [Polyangia bacterium]